MPSARASEKLLDDARDAAALVRRLMEIEGAKFQVLMRSCQAVAVTLLSMVGLAVGVTLGRGFIVRRLSPGVWSAPAYLSITGLSLGLTLGSSSQDSLVILADDLALAKFAEGGLELGGDARLTLSMVGEGAENWDANSGGAGVTGTQLSLSRRGDAVAFSQADGAAVDFSLKGGAVRYDDDAVRALFGPDATPERLLAGLVPPASEFALLYDALNQAAAAGGPA